jgi:hypothetical protein
MMESKEVEALATVHVDQPGLCFGHSQPKLSKELCQGCQGRFRIRLRSTHDDQIISEAREFSQVAIPVFPGLVQLVQVDVGQ